MLIRIGLLCLISLTAHATVNCDDTGLLGARNAEIIKEQIYKIIKDHEIKSRKPIKHKKQIVDIILKQARAYNLDPYVVAGIIKHESGFQIAAQNRKSKDYGLMQVNSYHIKVSKLSKSRLLTDISYNIKIGTGILAGFKAKYAKKEPETFYCRYNQGTRPYSKIKKGCLSYIKKIKRILSNENFRKM